MAHTAGPPLSFALGVINSALAIVFPVAHFLVGQVKKVRKFLRKVPVDPMTGEATWGLRSLQDDSDSTSWGRQNVYDVYSLSDRTGLDGTKYKDW